LTAASRARKIAEGWFPGYWLSLVMMLLSAPRFRPNADMTSRVSGFMTIILVAGAMSRGKS
jgi:hypothetical protein